MRLYLAIGSVGLFLFLAPHQAVAADVTLTLDAGFGFVIENDPQTVELLRIDEASGNVFRNGQLFLHTTGGTESMFFGEFAGNLTTTGLRNSGFGRSALSNNTSGSDNTAFGEDALFQNTIGANNSAFGEDALRANTNGGQNSAFGNEALRLNTGGFNNSAFGQRALESNSTGGRNSAFGQAALTSNTSAGDNSAFGWNALTLNTGTSNAAFGSSALMDNTTGNENAAFGDHALTNNMTGSGNAAFGRNALAANTTGQRNVALGNAAGASQTTGNDNVYIANQGIAGESGKIKIGDSAHTDTRIDGIWGNFATSGSAVLINGSNELHTLVSSARFKEAVRDMGDGSDVLMKLRPVTFRYREEAADENLPRDYGLIAEEVAEVAPDLVVNDEDGKPYSVRYHVLPSLLLNEVQKQREEIAALVARLELLESRLGTRQGAGE